MEHLDHHQIHDAHSAPTDEAPQSGPAPDGQHHATGGHAGHDRHEGHSVTMFRDKFWLSLALTIPVVLLSPDIHECSDTVCRRSPAPST